MIQSPSVEVIRVERSRKESRNRAVLDLEEMKEDEQSIRGDQNDGKYAHPVNSRCVSGKRTGTSRVGWDTKKGRFTWNSPYKAAVSALPCH
ncbi:unnamed protein product [Brassica napus]|uniref:(rape) hypothetical protein n=1 Tax=Brassica napus TaxID=3708 RepID=A0A816YZ61_BRANA|nr:unnamed protein product [Brassica napus]